MTGLQGVHNNLNYIKLESNGTAIVFFNFIPFLVSRILLSFGIIQYPVLYFFTFSLYMLFGLINSIHMCLLQRGGWSFPFKVKRTIC